MDTYVTKFRSLIFDNFFVDVINVEFRNSQFFFWLHFTLDLWVSENLFALAARAGRKESALFGGMVLFLEWVKS